MPGEFAHALVAVGIPQLDRPLDKSGAGRNHAGVRRDCHRRDLIAVRGKLAQLFASGRLVNGQLPAAPSDRNAISAAEKIHTSGVNSSGPGRILN